MRVRTEIKMLLYTPLTWNLPRVLIAEAIARMFQYWRWRIVESRNICPWDGKSPAIKDGVIIVEQMGKKKWSGAG